MLWSAVLSALLLLATVLQCKPETTSNTTLTSMLSTSTRTATNLTSTTVAIDINPLHVIQHANWTAMVSRIQDPANRGYIMSLAMTASLIMAIFGYRFIRIWLFMGGFMFMASTFYIWSPSIFVTEFCCGPGTERSNVGGLECVALRLYCLCVRCVLTNAACWC
eukprot:m.143989 g.143989  ORF g.143989 m.143989 type:complete len:164 (-) comp16183_c0_seq1:2681-3172(-)